MDQALPAKLTSVAELDELLSRPSAGLVSFMKQLDGDIMVVGAGGKVGPTLTRLVQRAITAAKVQKKVVAVDVAPLNSLAAEGIDTHRCDVMDLDAVGKLPKTKNIVYLIGRKFGSTGAESLTWAVNCTVAYHAARAFQGCRIAGFSTGCVYPVMHLNSGGATEETTPEPVGEYAQSCLGRERMWDYYADQGKLDMVHIRLNYAVECRYGVLYDIGSKVWAGEPVDVTTGYANVIWQGDACNQIVQALGLASHPASILNVTGPETFSVRLVAEQFARLMGKKAEFSGQENGYGYLNNAAKANGLYGNPTVPLARIVDYTAQWIMAGGANLGKPTHFETQNGKY